LKTQEIDISFLAQGREGNDETWNINEIKEVEDEKVLTLDSLPHMPPIGPLSWEKHNKRGITSFC